MNPLIYSVEDDVNIQNVIQIALTNSNFKVRSFDNAKMLFSALNDELPDLLLLDIMLPDMDGIQILKNIKSNTKYMNIPIMIISAKTSEIDRVIGLDTGADDYLVKPFGVLELVSRVKALLRRFMKDEPEIDRNIKGLEISKADFVCRYHGEEISLTKKQFDLLWYLMEHNNQTLSRDNIMNNIWGYEFVGETRTIDVHIKELRKKLLEAGVDGETIETIRGIGYRFKL